jgi:hypothetical protein
MTHTKFARAESGGRILQGPYVLVRKPHQDPVIENDDPNIIIRGAFQGRVLPTRADSWEPREGLHVVEVSIPPLLTAHESEPEPTSPVLLQEPEAPPMLPPPSRLLKAA